MSKSAMTIAATMLAACLTVLGSAPPEARAGDNDLVIARLGVLQYDNTGVVVGVRPDHQLYRSLMSELGVLIAPTILSPSDTLGFGGFQFSADLGFTSITDNASYWRVLQSSPAPQVDRADSSVSHGSGSIPTISLFVRKGLWFPLPSFELGTGVTHIISSGMYAAQGYAKFGIVEGYHDLPLPSIAVRGGGSRLMGTRELDLTVASIDVSASKMFGIGSTWNLSPYLGWNMLIIVPRSEVLMRSADMVADGVNTKFVFRNQADILRQRYFLGAKFRYYKMAVTAEFSLATAGTSVDDISGTDTLCSTMMDLQTRCDPVDASGSQSSFHLSAAFDF